MLRWWSNALVLTHTFKQRITSVINTHALTIDYQQFIPSQVGIQVNCEDLFSDRRWRVCHAYATFVTQRTNTGKKVRGVFYGIPNDLEAMLTILAFKNVCVGTVKGFLTLSRHIYWCHLTGNLEAHCASHWKGAGWIQCGGRETEGQDAARWHHQRSALPWVYPAG